jgi:hypothetical protein
MNSLFDKAASNFTQIVKASNSSKRSSTATYNLQQQQQQQYHQFYPNSKLIDVGVQTSSSLVLSSSNAGQDNKMLTMSSSNTTSSFNSHATQLIQTNPFGSIVANYGSASIMQRSQTARLLGKEKNKYRLRAYSDYNVLSLSRSPSDAHNNQLGNVSFGMKKDELSPMTASATSSPSQAPPPYHNSVSSSKLVQMNLQI